MKKDYATPMVTFEAYSLTSNVAGACSESEKTPIGNVQPITIENVKVHCVIANSTESKNCSKGAHTWTSSLSGTIFADGDKVGGCTHDVYTQKQYVDLLVSSLGSGSTVSGGPCDVDGTHFCFKGESHQHTGSFEGIDYANYFTS